MGFFTEQWAPPDRVTYDLPETVPGSLKEVSRHGGGFVQREIQAQVYLTTDVAKSLLSWLQERIEIADEVAKQIAESQKLDGGDSASPSAFLIEEKP